MNRLYILIPHGTRTGGPEALLQLSDALLSDGNKLTYVVFYDNEQIAYLRQTPLQDMSALVFGARTQDIAEYADYRLQVADQIPDESDVTVVLPEVLADLTPRFRRSSIILWWLSVDNAFAALARINLNHLRRENVLHATQSAYSRRFIEALGLRHAGALSDYTSPLFCNAPPISERGNCVALNAGSKVVLNIAELEAQLTKLFPNLQITRIVGMNREQVLDALRRARIFVDLGNFPGKDRLAREAALLGCAVIVADAGAGSTTDDYSISSEDRVSPCSLPQIRDRILYLLENESDALKNSARLRKVVLEEKPNFITEVRSLMAVVERIGPKVCGSLTATPAPLLLTPNGANSHVLPDCQKYSNWRSRSSLTEIDAEVLAERMMLKWTKRPGIHLLMALRGGEEHLLADTLDSLAAQLYPDWLLTVVTDLPQPEGMDEAPSVQWLSLQDAIHIDYVIEEVAAASPGTWLARIDPGLTFEPHALQVIADYINVRPMWHLIYCDEDTREADGRFTQPLFKPDLNLDLLRAQNYFGTFVLVEKEAFNVVGRYGPHRGAESYDLSLRILDQVGPESIGHIDQMLVHLPRESTHGMEPEAEKRAVVDHLQRCGLDAEVREGLVPGTRHVEYRWPTAPLVSIVIQTRDREEYLRPMLDSLDELTAYSNYELIIVDNDTQDPDAVDWLKTLPDDPRWRGRAKVLHATGPFNWAAGANAGARAARGDYLLFLDNDMHVVQDEWLNRMIGIAQRPEVGIVGPRLAFAETARVQETGWVLGLHGLAGSPWKSDMDLTDPGYMGRAVCDQRVGAVSGSALLVRTSLFVEIGGFDADAFPVFDGALDLCLRVSELGKDVVWTPYSMIVHYGGVSMHERQTDPAAALSDLIARKAEREQVLSRWLPQLANDPSYNRHLSLVEPFKPEHIAPITWDTRFHDRPRIMGIPLSGAAGEYRLRAPLRTIARAGLAEILICEPPAPTTVRILSAVEFARAAADVVVFHQPVDDLQAESLQSLARLLPGTRRIITIDDLITAVPKKNSFHKFGFKDARPRLRKTLRLAERLVVSTEPLADFCRGMIDDIRLVPNCLERAIWDGVLPPGLPRRKPRVGWAGAQQHLGDLELIYPVVEALADEVDWIFMGMCPDPIRPFVREFHDFVRDFERYPAALARLDLDLAVAPLEINAFNEAKSNLRLLEYGFMGWPVICTDIFPYQNALVTRLPNDPQQWIATIREQLADPEGLRKAGSTLQDWVLGGFMIEDHAERWLDAYRP